MKLEVTGLEEVKALMTDLTSKLTNLKPLWPRLASVFWNHEQEVFDQEGAISEWSGWTPLNPDYLKWKQSHGFSSMILNKTGDLRDSLTGMAAGTIYRASENSFGIGTKIKYAKYHHKGEGVPIREPVRTNETLVKNIETIVNNFMAEPPGMMSRAGGRIKNWAFNVLSRWR